LTIVRSLARRGIPVIVGDEARGFKSYFGEAMLSKYATHRFLYPSPRNAPNEFIRRINEISSKYNAEILFPVASDTYVTVSAYRDQLHKDIQMMITDDNLIQKAHDKYECIRYAADIGVKVPKTILLRDIRDVKDLETLGLPLVLKPRRGSGSKGVQIINRISDLMRLKANLGSELENIAKCNGKRSLVYDDSDPIVQEFVDGPINDACVIANRGNIKAILTQTRIKTLPPNGGYGVMNRTVSIPEIREITERILADLGWHGVAQVEFKLDTKTGEYNLIEINPKFWGTLALSIEAGIDFPYMAYQIAVGAEVEERFSFRENCVYRWVIPNELLHVLQSENKKYAFRRYILDFFKPANYNFDLRDPLPIFSLLLKIISRSHRN
jgi:predicted ATP-grasp superfamily ATP-dependent carboligase